MSQFIKILRKWFVFDRQSSAADKKTVLFNYALIGAVILLLYMFSQPEDPQVAMWKELANVTGEVCENGLKYEDAPDYHSATNITIVIAPYKRYETLFPKYEEIRDANQYFPDEILPIPGQLPNLVACLSAEEVGIQVCEYINGPDITRYRLDKFLTIRAIKTGEFVHEETFVGENPRACKKTESSGTNQLYGSSISDEDLANWIVEWLP